MAEYRRLKNEAEKQSTRLNTDLDNKQQEQVTCKNAISYENGQLTTFKEKIKRVLFFFIFLKLN